MRKRTQPRPPERYLPTPEEIAEATAEIRSRWTPQDFFYRRAGDSPDRKPPRVYRIRTE